MNESDFRIRDTEVRITFPSIFPQGQMVAVFF